MQASASNKLGLSILIPVYNYPLEGLVKTLYAQLQPFLPAVEIILLDDGSSARFIELNGQLENIPAITFHRNEKNLGRLATRLKLSGLARFDHLLFLDADSEIKDPRFLEKYVEQVNKGVDLVTGGREYSIEEPPCEFRLHWKYGSIRENRKTGKPAFMSNNFLIKKEIFSRLDHSVKLEGYGHEDSWWGMQFEKMNIECGYIDNPVLHGSLERSGDFILKSEQALDNLLQLAKLGDEQLLEKHIRIYRVFKKLKSSGTSGLFLAFEKTFHKRILKNLLSCNPSLRYFDWYRLALLFKISRKDAKIRKDAMSVL